MAKERTLKEYATPFTEEPYAIIVYPTVEGNNFEMNLHLFTLCNKINFSDHPLRIWIFMFQIF